MMKPILVVGGGVNNPYCVEDVFDLTHTGNDTFHLMLVNDVDFNDHPTYRYGLSGQYIIRAASLNGNNHSIYNMIFDNASLACLSVDDSIYDTNFVNLIFKNVTASSGASVNSAVFKAKLTRCNFGIYMTNSNPQRAMFYNNSIYDCSFTIKGDLKDYGLQLGTANFARCHFNLDCSTSATNIIHGHGGGYRFTFQDTGVTGVVRSTSTTYRDGMPTCEIADGYWYNSYVALETPSRGIYVTNTVIVNSVSFVVEKLGDSEKVVSAGSAKLLTEEQAKDPSYLQSIGFLTI